MHYRINTLVITFGYHIFEFIYPLTIKKSFLLRIVQYFPCRPSGPLHRIHRSARRLIWWLGNIQKMHIPKGKKKKTFKKCYVSTVHNSNTPKQVNVVPTTEDKATEDYCAKSTRKILRHLHQNAYRSTRNDRLKRKKTYELTCHLFQG